MSINSALNNALSGLNAASRIGNLISSNISNAMTEGYAPRQLELSARSSGEGGGVLQGGVQRKVDTVLLNDRRLADAELANASTQSDFLNQVARLFGTPDDPDSLSAKLTRVESALTMAADDPSSGVRLGNVTYAADQYAKHINRIADGIQDLRKDADTAIGRQVDRLNSALVEVETLNKRIVATEVKGRDASALLDNRQRLIDSISEIVPVRVVAGRNNSVSLFTTGGATLLDPSARTIGFSQAGMVAAHLTVAGGTLSGLSLDDEPVATTDGGSFSGGSLAAAFKVRDDLAIAAQENIDAVARDLIERFQDPAVDPTLGVNDPGIFTDAGSAFDPLDEVGLAGRIALNAAIDPNQSGQPWRLRDGLNAAAQGEVGQAAQLLSLRQALLVQREPLSGSVTTDPVTAAALAYATSSRSSTDAQNSDGTMTFVASRQSTLKAMELEGGVDTDHELQELLLVERLYAANTRVIQTVDEMLDALMRI